MSFLGASLPLDNHGLQEAADLLGVDTVNFWSVVTVETRGCGFLPDRRPKILFERHIFHKKTSGNFGAAHPEISHTSPGGWGREGSYQYERLGQAITCNRKAALESASWGIGQVMGFNAQPAGFRDAEHMVSAMVRGENEQLLAMAKFIRAQGMHTALQRRDWAGFATRYNGPGSVERYGGLLSGAHAKLSRTGLPHLGVRAVQLLLTYHGFDPGHVDGIEGKRTTAAIQAFAAKYSLEPTLDGDELRAALLEKLAPAESDGQSSGPALDTAPSLRVVQALLEHLGFDPGPVDGLAGPRTRKAMAAFRTFQGGGPASIDGALGGALDAECRRRWGRNHRADTRLVQRLLAFEHFDPGPVDGIVGAKTKAAIASYARARGITAAEVDVALLSGLLASVLSQGASGEAA